tara:strand:+ start:222 stop:485 length:264 start_codon:yes stop_codon:yes gene_type:complete
MAFKMAGWSAFQHPDHKGHHPEGIDAGEGERETIAYGDIKNTEVNRELIKQQNILNDEKNEHGANWTDEQFADWQNRMNAVRAQFQK